MRILEGLRRLHGVDIQPTQNVGFTGPGGLPILPTVMVKYAPTSYGKPPEGKPLQRSHPMQKYRKRPVVIEAIQWDGEQVTLSQLAKWWPPMQPLMLTPQGLSPHT